MTVNHTKARISELFFLNDSIEMAAAGQRLIFDIHNIPYFFVNKQQNILTHPKTYHYLKVFLLFQTLLHESLLTIQSSNKR
jgi:hypothetical protein